MVLMIPEMFMMTASMAQLTTVTGAQAAANDNLTRSNVGVAASGAAATASMKSMMFWAGAAGAAMFAFSVALVKLGNKLGWFEDALDGLSFDEIMEDAAEAAELMNAEMQAMIGDTMLVADAFNEAGEAVQAFGSNREELFFGFKAGNVTGDLVKQIKQQGVENFVQNTEVIMTNNFNGMTTPEVAEAVVSLIAEELGLSQGASVSYGA